MTNQDDIVLINIVTHNSKDIFKVLDLLRTEIKDNQDYMLSIYDNASDEAYKNRLNEYSDFATITFSETNDGFGHGHNEIFLKSNYKFGIVFNPDILVSIENLEAMKKLLMSDNQLAMVCPKVLNEDGTIQYLVRNHLDVFDYFLRFIPFKFIKKLFNKRLSRYECRDLSDKQNGLIRMGSGCFMFIDIDKFKAVDGFDERFFMYFEDNDLCRKLEMKNDKILYTPIYPVVHLYAKGSHRNPKLFFVFIQSMIRYFNKWGWNFF